MVAASRNVSRKRSPRLRSVSAAVAPPDLAARLEDDMRVLSLDGPSDTIREALRLLHRHARQRIATARPR